jgi:hypothetical protein
LSPGVRRFGGSPAGPAWSTETPFSGAPATGTLALSASSYSVNEGTATLTIPVRRSGGSSGTASVNISVTAGTATAGADYTVTSPVTLNWADGDAADKSIVVTIINDVQPESDETFQVALSTATGATLGTPASATATIQDNDAAPQPGTLQFSGATATVGEAAGSITLTVNRVSGTDGAVSVNYSSANGSATAGSDYTATSGTLNFANGQASATFQVPISDDVAVEGAETFTLTLASPAGGAALGAPVTVTVTITDNDAAPPPPPPPGGGGGGGAAGWPSLGCLLLLAWLGIGRRERLSAA